MKKILIMLCLLLPQYTCAAAAAHKDEIVAANIERIKKSLQDPRCSIRVFFEEDEDLVGNIVTGFDYYPRVPIDTKHFCTEADAQHARKYLVVLSGYFPTRIWILADRGPEFVASSISSMYEFFNNRLFRSSLQQFAPRENLSSGGETIEQFIVNPAIDPRVQPRIFADFVYVFADGTLKIDARAQEHQDINSFRIDACWPGDPYFGNRFDTSSIFKCRQCLIL